MIGYDEDELKNFTFTDITYPDDISIGSSQLKKMLDGEIESTSFEKRYIRKDKQIIWAYVSTSLIRGVNRNSHFFITQVIDITEHKRAEEEITMLAHSLRSVNECVSITDMEDKILFVNESFLKTYGYGENELIGKNISIVRSLNNPLEFVKEILPATKLGEWQGELWNKRKNGSEFPIFLSTTIINDKDLKPLGLIGVATDITERKRTEKELIEAKDRAEKSDQLKSEFLAQMSHEIRSPMNAVISFANLLKEDLSKDLTPDHLEYFAGIDSAGHRLIRTVELILNASELQVGTYIPDFTDIGLMKEILEKINNEYILLIEEKGLKYNFISNISEAVIHGDKYSIHQLFVNLMDNAVKYTEKGSISVMVEKNKNTSEIKVTIEDTGIGMSEEYMGQMYKQFSQENRGYTRRYEGNGLGLSLVKKYCELNGITIEVKSKKGIGTKFVLIFTSTK